MENGEEGTAPGGTRPAQGRAPGLKSDDAYELEKHENGQWVKVDQSVQGNDYWQCWFDSEKGSYELTFNAEHSGDANAQYSYRLVKK